MLPGPAQTLQRIMGSGTVRLMAVAGLSLAAVWGLKASSGSTDDTLALQQILEVCTPLPAVVLIFAPVACIALLRRQRQMVACVLVDLAGRFASYLCVDTTCS